MYGKIVNFHKSLRHGFLKFYVSLSEVSMAYVIYPLWFLIISHLQVINRYLMCTDL